MASDTHMDLFSLVISDIKTYTGGDPLRPWIKGIRKIRQGLPPHIVSEKLPRFLQKCAQTFGSDRRYRNDSRYVAVWIQLMDYVKKPRLILQKMKKSEIGAKRAEFYVAYAVYYVKKKRFEDAEKMYHLGVQNLAEPVEELQKSYDEFLHRMKRIKQRRAKLDVLPMASEATSSGNPPQTASIKHGVGDLHRNVAMENSMEKLACAGQNDPAIEKVNCVAYKSVDQPQPFVTKAHNELDSCRHGLLDPTINTEEAMDAISNMFKDALESDILPRSSNPGKSKSNQYEHAIEIFVDENMEEPSEGDHGDAKVLNPDSQMKKWNVDLQKPYVGAFKILADDEEDDDGGTNGDCSEIEEQFEGYCQTIGTANSDGNTEARTSSSDVRFKEDTVVRRLREDTVIRKFVGSTVFDEPKVENACHHGLVDPTVNLKQAMDDINGMFGETLHFAKVSKPKKKDKLLQHKPSANQSFFILTDENVEKDLEEAALLCNSHGSTGESCLFEPTVFTKEAINEINELFGKPLDF